MSKVSRVHSQIYKSKKIIAIDELNKFVDYRNNHACVVIDTGTFMHIDFCLGRNRIVKFVDLIKNKKIIYDDNGHGTFVTGILASNSITKKYSGIDNSCDIIVIKALDKNGETSPIVILKAFSWVLKNKQKYNIKVVCMSFGSDIGEGVDPLIKGVETLWDSGIVVVVAGGNSGPKNGTIMSPGASSKVITVGALDSSGVDYRVADFSSRGPALGNYKPDLVVPGVDVTSTNVFGKKKEFYTTMTGTSVAAPIVAGVVSLLLKVNPRYTPNQIKYMLVKSCDPICGDRNVEGFGVLNLKKLVLI